jgi:aspartate aminotransferase, chloroplastic
MEYLPVQGLQAFLDQVLFVGRSAEHYSTNYVGLVQQVLTLHLDFQTSKVILGADSPLIKEKKVAVVQSLSGTGALRICAEFLSIYNPGTVVYVSDPTWTNHHNIFKKAGLEVKTYRYLTKTMSLDIDGMLADLKAAPQNATFVLHTVAHNPSGVDPTQDQWKLIAEVVKEKNAIPVFDTAYQGYATGDLDKDAWSVRYFAHELGMELMVTQSYSKNFGLYGERIGALNIVTKDTETAGKIRSQLNGIIRPMYSNPQLHGARLVAAVVSDPALYKQWDEELKLMAGRITAVRTALRDALIAISCPTPSSNYSSWDHIVQQIGMFAYTGLEAKHVEILEKKWHIYCTKNGRFSMAGVNLNNAEYIAKAIKDALATAGPSAA